MNGAHGTHRGGEPVPAPTEAPARTGEGAQTALLALIRKRRLQGEGHEDAVEPPRSPKDE